MTELKDKIEAYIEIAVKASLKAGDEILKIYGTDDFNIEKKKDDSPLTLADKKAHEIIMEYLKETDIPVLSEEGKGINYEERKNWALMWLVDPIDGTKEFIKRNGEFTVNIALIREGTPIAGVIYVPVNKDLYFANCLSSDSYKSENISIKDIDNNLSAFKAKSDKLPLVDETDVYTVVGSRSHMNNDTREFIEELKKEHKEIDIMSRGSSLKICMIAEGRADVYPRFAPTMEWDTGAGHAIAVAAGKTVLQKESRKPLVYNKEDLLNPHFIIE